MPSTLTYEQQDAKWRAQHANPVHAPAATEAELRSDLANYDAIEKVADSMTDAELEEKIKAAIVSAGGRHDRFDRPQILPTILD